VGCYFWPRRSLWDFYAVADLEPAKAYQLTADESRQFLDLHAGLPAVAAYLSSAGRVPPWGITVSDADGRVYIIWWDHARDAGWKRGAPYGYDQPVQNAVETGDLHIIDASGFPRLTNAITEAEYVPPIEAAAKELYKSVRELSLQRFQTIEEFMTLAAVLGGVLVLMNFAGAVKGAAT
jgi:hypothetical protein